MPRRPSRTSPFHSAKDLPSTTVAGPVIEARAQRRARLAMPGRVRRSTGWRRAPSSPLARSGAGPNWLTFGPDLGSPSCGATSAHASRRRQSSGHRHGLRPPCSAWGSMIESLSCSPPTFSFRRWPKARWPSSAAPMTNDGERQPWRPSNTSPRVGPSTPSAPSSPSSAAAAISRWVPTPRPCRRAAVSHWKDWVQP